MDEMQSYKTNSEDYIEDDFYLAQDMIEKSIVIGLFIIAVVLAVIVAVTLKIKGIW